MGLLDFIKGKKNSDGPANQQNSNQQDTSQVNPVVQASPIDPMQDPAFMKGLMPGTNTQINQAQQDNSGFPKQNNSQIISGVSNQDSTVQAAKPNTVQSADQMAELESSFSQPIESLIPDKQVEVPNQMLEQQQNQQANQNELSQVNNTVSQNKIGLGNNESIAQVNDISNQQANNNVEQAPVVSESILQTPSPDGFVDTSIREMDAVFNENQLNQTPANESDSINLPETSNVSASETNSDTSVKNENNNEKFENVQNNSNSVVEEHASIPTSGIEVAQNANFPRENDLQQVEITASNDFQPNEQTTGDSQIDSSSVPQTTSEDQKSTNQDINVISDMPVLSDTSSEVEEPGIDSNIQMAAASLNDSVNVTNNSNNESSSPNEGSNATLSLAQLKNKKKDLIFKKIAFLGLSGPKFDTNLSNVILNTVKELFKYKIEVLINTTEGLAGQILAANANLKNKISLSAYQPFISDSKKFSQSNTNGVTATIVYSNYLEWVKHMVKEARLFILVNGGGTENHIIFLLLTEVAKKYQSQQKPIILLGDGWQDYIAKINSMLEENAIDESLFHFASSNSEVIEHIVNLENEYANMDLVKIPRVVDRRVEGDEMDFIIY